MSGPYRYPIDPRTRGPKRTICEVLREIYRLTESPEIHERLDEAHDMAKRMDRRLLEYRSEWDQAQVHEDELREIAKAFPSMGGVEIGTSLERYASEVPEDQAIVEVGCWLGAGTAHLALGARLSGATIHVYDRFSAKEGEVKKATAFGVDLSVGESTLSRVMRFLRPFGAKIAWHRGNIARAKWNGQPIGLYVDDASKLPKIWAHSATTFLPHVQIGGVVVLMDYHFHERAGEQYASQARHMERNRDRFEIIEDRIGGTTAAAFRRTA